VKVDVQQPIPATLVRIALILAITITAMVLISRWPLSGLLPAFGAVAPFALLWGWAELRLHRVRRSAEAQHQKMRMLTGSLAHDLRTPLCTAMNAVGNLREATRRTQPDPERIERAYGAAEKSLQRCHHLITAVLDYSRGGQHQRQPLDIDGWLEKTVAEFPLPAGIRLSTRFTAPAQVAAAPCQLRRALHNLMENAVQAMTAAEAPAEGHRLEVTSRVRRSRVEICVRDTGPGIPEEAYAKVFTPLYTNREGGVGLGLAIVQDVARQHDGEARLASSPGQGARFTLTLPSL
jgi:signal transduction histidine kinase